MVSQDSVVPKSCVSERMFLALFVVVRHRPCKCHLGNECNCSSRTLAYSIPRRGANVLVGSRDSVSYGYQSAWEEQDGAERLDVPCVLGVCVCAEEGGFSGPVEMHERRVLCACRS